MLLFYFFVWGDSLTHLIIIQRFSPRNNIIFVKFSFIVVEESVSCYICNVEGGDEGDFAVLGGRVDAVFVFDGVEMVAFFEIFHEEVRADCGRGEYR